MKLNYLLMALVLVAGFAYACNDGDVVVSYYSPVNLGDTNDVSLVIWVLGDQLNDTNATLDMNGAFTTTDANPSELGDLAPWYYQNNSVWSITAVTPGVYNLTVNVTHEGDSCQARTEVTINAPVDPELELNVSVPATIYTNQAFTFSGVLANTGSSVANNVNVSIEVDNQTVVTGPAEIIYAQLFNGNTVYPDFTLTVSSPGFHTFRMIALDDEGDYVLAEVTREILTAPLIRDVAITSLTYSPSPVPTGTNATINATVENQGELQALTLIHFNINGGYLGNQSVNLAPGSSQNYQVSFFFASEGTFSLNSTVDAVAGESDLADNFMETNVTVQTQEPDDDTGDDYNPGGGGGTAWSGSPILECYSDSECSNGEICFENACVLPSEAGGSGSDSDSGEGTTPEGGQLRIEVLTEEMVAGGIIEVMTVDDSGNALQGAEVRQNGIRVGLTGADGKIFIENVQDGDMIWAGKSGYVSYQVQIDIEAGTASPVGFVSLVGDGALKEGRWILLLLLLAGGLYLAAGRSLKVDITGQDFAKGQVRFNVRDFTKKPVDDALVHIDDILVGRTNQNGQIGVGGVRKNASIKIKKKGYLPAQKFLKN
ncbi:CARDB domain-containing protein [Candidatus Undinarchaeota archaeon]